MRKKLRRWTLKEQEYFIKHCFEKSLEDFCLVFNADRHQVYYLAEKLKIPYSIINTGKVSYKTLYAQYVAGARYRDLVFDLSFDKFCEIVNKSCSYCGEKRKYNVYAGQDRIRYANRNSISQEGINRAEIFVSGVDRIDNEVGYTQENSVPCCSKCNILKRNLSVVDFIFQVEKIHNHFIQGKE